MKRPYHSTTDNHLIFIFLLQTNEKLNAAIQKKIPRFNLGDKLKFGVSNYPKVKPTDGNQMDFRKRGIFMWVEKSTEIFVRENVCMCV